MSSTALPSIASLEYRDLTAALPFAGGLPLSSDAEPPLPQAPAGPSEAEVSQRIEAACARVRAETTAAAEVRLRAERERMEAEMSQRLASALESFEAERTQYFRRVEAEVVHLALGIARKVIGRESELDPALLCALVRVALERMNAGPAVRLRVAPEKLSWWQTRPEFRGEARFSFEFAADPALSSADCLVETDLGSANFGFESQLKSIEQGFFDLLAQRPADRSNQSTAGRPASS